MIQIVIEIGAVKTLNVENWRVILDDRQSTLETIGGVVVQDLGRVPAGDKFSCSVNVRAADADIIFGYWNNRTLVTVIDEAGNPHLNCRVIVKDYSYIPHFGNYYNLSIEIWRV